jgi:hypothetical protein
MIGIFTLISSSRRIKGLKNKCPFAPNIAVDIDGSAGGRRQVNRHQSLSGAALPLRTATFIPLFSWPWNPGEFCRAKSAIPP